jgi:hypothetical protein
MIMVAPANIALTESPAWKGISQVVLAAGAAARITPVRAMTTTAPVLMEDALPTTEDALAIDGTPRA